MSVRVFAPCIAGQTYLGYRSGKDNYLIQFTNPLHKLIDSWAFDDIYVVVLALNFHRNGEVSLVENLKIC
jgi:hypothetical protein